MFELFGGAGLEDRDPQQVIPPEERKAAMSGLDRTEHKLALGGLVLATLAGIGVPLWVVSQNRVDKAGKNSIAVAPDAWLLMAAILVFCVIGFVALWKAEADTRHLLAVPDRLRLHPVHWRHRVRLHPPWGLADAAGLAPQQVRLHERQGRRAKPRGRAREGERRSRERTSHGNRQDDVDERWSTQASNRQQALHPEGPTRKKIPKPTE